MVMTIFRLRALVILRISCHEPSKTLLRDHVTTRRNLVRPRFVTPGAPDPLNSKSSVRPKALTYVTERV